MSKQQQPKEEGPRSFGVFLNELAEGEAEQKLSAELFDLIRKLKEQAIASDGKIKGELNLKLRFVVQEAGPVAVGFDVTTKAPKVRNTPGYFWVTRGGNLTIHNPKQAKLPLREVSGPESREVEDEPVAVAREV